MQQRDHVGTKCPLLFVVLWAVTAAMAAVPAGGNWPGWRGDGSGISRDITLPVCWAAATHILWKTPLPGEGSSSPIVWGDRVFLTASTDGGKKRLVLCLNAKDGKVIWQQEIIADNVPQTDPKSGFAPATPVTDGKRVYVFFDSPGLLAFDMEGQECWRLKLGPFKSPYNVANSPVLYKDRVILCVDHSGDSFIMAVESATGRQIWKTPRKQDMQFATPLLITHDGEAQLIVNATTVKSYDPETGSEIWSCGRLNPTVVPSPVYENGMVYATSGRNGPAMAIDPGGSGDVKNTHVKMQVAIGGPYVISPLACPLLLLPGDDGNMRFIDDKGKTVVNERVRSHFTASPIVGGNNIYWTAENGETFVIDISKLTAPRPAVTVIARNVLGEKCLASPAVSRGRLFLRTVKALYCIAGAGGGTTPAVKPVAETFADLKKRFEANPAPEGPDVQVRLAVIEAMALLKDPQAVPFLRDVARRDPHWDVSEAAVKALAQQDDPATAAALCSMFEDSRIYLKATAAFGLGRLQAPAAAPTLLKGAREDDLQVRIACLQALADITGAHGEEAARVVPAFTAGMADADGGIRATAIRALGQIADTVGAEREGIVNGLLPLIGDANPLVATAAREALTDFKAPAERIKKAVSDLALYGEVRKNWPARSLTAGPIRLRFRDGELRYLCVGDKEIIRRIYFAVRDKRYDTVMPEFSRVEVKPDDKGGFTVHVEATCKNDVADYSWVGDIAGTADGVITFRVSGHANSDFTAPRVGLNILFGADALAGRQYQGIGKDGTVKTAVFPREVTARLLTEANFAALRYAAADGMQVSCSMTGNGFGLEDQRQYGDSSYKAYHALYPPGAMAKGVEAGDTLTLEVTNAVPKPAVAGPVQVTLGKIQPGRTMPKLLPAEQSQKTGGINEAIAAAVKDPQSAVIAWRYNPAAHMPDEDTFLENLSAIADQVRAVRKAAPRAAIRLDPVNFDSPYPRPARDLRNGALFGATWVAAAAGAMAQAGVDEAVFTVGPGPATGVQQRLARYAGCKLLTATTSGPQPLPVLAFAVEGAEAQSTWLVNGTDQPQTVVLRSLLKGATALVTRINAETMSKPAPGVRQSASKDGVLTLRLAPYEVCEVVVRRAGK